MFVSERLIAEIEKWGNDLNHQGLLDRILRTCLLKKRSVAEIEDWGDDQDQKQEG